MAALGHTVDSGSGASGDYVSLNALEAAQGQDLTDGGGDTYTATCTTTGDNAADTTAMEFYGWVTGAANYILVEAASTDRASASGWDTNKYRIEVTDPATDAVIRLGEEYVQFDGVQLRVIYSALERDVIKISSISALNAIKFSNCYIRGDLNVASNSNGINSTDGNLNLTVWNTIFTDFDGKAIILLGNEIIIYNSIIYNCNSVGLYMRGVSNWTVKNTVVFETSDDFYDDTTGSIIIDYCASDDNDGTNNVAESGGGAAWPDDFEGAASGDFRLKSGSNLVGGGTDDPGSGLYSDDIEGTARGSPWDVGAFEYVAPGGGGIVVLRRRRM